jgi:hypothetical protein
MHVTPPQGAIASYARTGYPTPRIDHLAKEGLRLMQYLVEPGWTPVLKVKANLRNSVLNGTLRDGRKNQ